MNQYKYTLYYKSKYGTELVQTNTKNSSAWKCWDNQEQKWAKVK